MCKANEINNKIITAINWYKMKFYSFSIHCLISLKWLKCLKSTYVLMNRKRRSSWSETLLSDKIISFLNFFNFRTCLFKNLRIHFKTWFIILLLCSWRSMSINMISWILKKMISNEVFDWINLIKIFRFDFVNELTNDLNFYIFITSNSLTLQKILALLRSKFCSFYAIPAVPILN